MENEDQILGLYTDDNNFAKYIGDDAFNAIKEQNPNNLYRLRNSVYFAGAYGGDAEQIYNEYETFAKSKGFTGDYAVDSNSIHDSLKKSWRDRKIATSMYEGTASVVKESWANYEDQWTTQYLSSKSIRDAASQLPNEISRLQRELDAEQNPVNKSKIKAELAKSKTMLRAVTIGRANAAQERLENDVEKQSLKFSESLLKIRSAEGLGETVSNVNPLNLSQIILGSLVEQGPAAPLQLAAGTITGGIGIGAMGAAGAFSQEIASNVETGLKQAGIDLTKLDGIDAQLSDKKDEIKEIYSSAAKKAIPVAIAAFVGGKKIGGSGLGGAVADVGAQTTLDVMGETLGQLWQTGDVDTADVFMEGIASIGPNLTQYGAKVATGFVTEKFTSIAARSDGTPITSQEWSEIGKAITDEEVSGLGLNPLEEAAVILSKNGDINMQKMSAELVESAADVPLSEITGSSEVDVQFDEILKLTEGIMSVESEIESNLDTDESIGDVPIRPGDKRDSVDLSAKRRSSKRLSSEEKISVLNEKLSQQKNDAKLKLKEALRKKDAFYQEKIDTIKQKKYDKAREDVLMAKEIRDSIRDTEKLIRSMPKDFQSKFPKLGRMADAKTIDALMKTEERIKNKINNIYIDETRKVLVGKIRKTVEQHDKNLKKASGAKEKFKYGEELSRHIGLSGLGGPAIRQLAQSRYEDLIGRVQEAEGTDSPYQMTESDFDIQREALVPDLSKDGEYDIDALESYLADLESIKKDGLSSFKLKEKLRKESVVASANKIANKIAVHNAKTKTGKLSPDDIAYSKGIKESISGLNKEILDIRSVNAILTGEQAGPIKRLIIDPIADGVSESIVKHREYSDFIKKTAKDVGVDVFKSGEVPIPNVDIGGKQVSMYEGMFVYGHSQNDIGLAHLEGTKFNNQKLAPYIDSIVDNLPDEHKAFVDKLIDYNDTVMYDRVSDLYKKMYGIPMPKEARYLPIMNLNHNSAFDLASKENPAFMRMHMAFMKSRSGGVKGFRSLDLIGSLEFHNSSAEHAIALHDALTTARDILNDNSLQEQISIADPNAVSYLKEYIRDVAVGEINHPKNKFVKLLRNLRNNTRTYWLAVSPGSWMKTQAPILSAAQEIGSAEMGAAMVRHFSRSNWITAREKSMFMKARPHTNRIERAEIANRQFEASKLGIASVSARARSLNRWTQDRAYWMYDPLDLAATSTVWVAKYTEQINKHGVESKAIRTADDVVKKHFPSGRVDELPPLFRDSGLLKEFTIFTADMNRMYNLGFTSQQLKTKRVMRAMSFAFYSVFLSSAYLAFTDMGQDMFKEIMGLREEPDDRTDQLIRDMSRYMASQTVGGIPLVGKTVEAGVASAVGDGQLSRMMAAQTPISLYPAAQAMKGNYWEAVASAAGVPGGNILAPMIDDFIESDSDTDNEGF